MANNNKHITPGLYTKIEDLSQATAAISTTTLGLVGETLKGPAFEPIKITSKAHFLSIFGGQSPVKKGVNLKYELPYVANLFLEESNQLYVTRVLGIGGYDALTPYVITTKDENDDDVILAVIRSSSPVTISGEGTNDPTTSRTIINIGTKSYNTSFVYNDTNKISNIITRIPNEDHYLELYFQADLQEGQPVSLDVSNDSDKSAEFNVGFQTPQSPMVISDIDTNVSDMFRFISISDGNSANYEIKISFENIDTVSREFDVVIREYSDVDKTPVVLEVFRRCTMNPKLASYIGKRIGTYNGEYTVMSSYVTLELADNCPITALPSGMKGFELVNYADGFKVPYSYKLVQPDDASPRELRRNYLGWNFEYNSNDILKFHGVTDLELVKYDGFHLEDLSDYQGEKDGLQHPNNVFLKTNESILANRFTIPLMGGFDGWDIFQKDNFYKLADNDDYKSFIKATKSMMNPDETPINLFATPGLNYYDNSLLVNEILDMVEEDRGDCVYIINSPDYPEVDYDDSEAYALDLVDMLDASGLDSMYGATYASHVQHLDVQNGVNIWLPVTGEVLMDMAKTDKKQAPWFATAGINRGALKSARAKYKINTPASDTLYKGRINPIKTISNKPYIFGNKNLQTADTALNRINIVRCVLQIQKLVSTVAFSLLFEPNDDELQMKFKALVEPILENVRKQRGLIDAKVICDDSNNTAADRDQLQLNGYILLKPTNATEYINITYGVTSQGADFSIV